MSHSRLLRRLLPAALVAAALLSLAPPLMAQTSSSGVRPGSNTSRPGGTSTTGSTGSTNRSSTSGGTGSSSSSSGGRQYRSATELGDAVIQIDPETRTIIIVTDEDTHHELEKVIRDLDKPKPQVLIKVVFLEVTYNKDFDFGVEGSYTFNLKNPVTAATTAVTTATGATGTTGTTTTGTTGTTGTTTTSTAATGGSSVQLQSLFGLASSTAQGSFVRVASDNWSATLHALESHGKVEVLSRPSIMARNNQEAVIVVGSEVPFITNSRTDALGNLTNTIQYDDVGIILRVTPFITANNSVEMIVSPEISALTAQTVPISSNASAPVISKRSAETVVVTPNGLTAVIGGLMQTSRTSTIDKIPVLGDIPWAGALFRHKVINDVKSELLIFLTPTIINTPGQVESTAATETENTELVKGAFTEKDFDKFFDAVEENPKPVIPALEKKGVPTKKTTTTTIIKQGATPAPARSLERTTTTTIIKHSATPAPRPEDTITIQ